MFKARRTKVNHKVVAALFDRFEKDIIKANSKMFKDGPLKIDYINFERDIKKTMLSMFKDNVSKTTTFSTKLFDWTIEDSKLNIVRNKAIEEYNKILTAKKVKNISDTTRNQIQTAIDTANREGLNDRDIAKRIIEKIGNMKKGRALTIARTETSNAIERTNRLTAEEAGVKTKEWLHVGAGKTPRHNHVKLDGKKKKINEKFDLGNGILADTPHDNDLPASEIINCHCCTIYN